MCLDYLNLRRAKISADAVASIAPMLGKQGSVKTLVLDGIKLAGTGALNNLFGSGFSFLKSNIYWFNYNTFKCYCIEEC